MSGASHIDITIDFKRTNSTDWESVRLTPEEFFELEPGETPGLDSVPAHDHAVQYLQFDPRRVRTTRLSIRDPARNDERRIIETFWNDGQNRVIERIDTGAAPHWEMILEMHVGEGPTVWEIVRLGREGDVLVPLHHGHITDNQDGSQTETQVSVSGERPKGPQSVTSHTDGDCE
jgi:hypothetical protein